MNGYTTYSDNELVELLAASDESAFNEIYERYWKRMYAMAFLKLKKVADAEDIVQDVLTSLWFRRKSSQIGSLEKWLSAATKYKIINKINRQLKKEIFPDHIEDIPYIDARAEQRLLNELLAAHIRQLPEKCRIVFQHSRDDGYSNAEIARHLHISEKAVEKHITTARRQLTVHFKQLLQSIFF